MTHEGDVLAPKRRRVLAGQGLRSRSILVQGLAVLTALGVLVLLIGGHGVAWLAGLVAGASTAAWVARLRTPSPTAAPAVVDHGDDDTRERLGLLEAVGWRAVHDVDARYGRYRHVAIGPGGVILVQSQRLEYPWAADDPRAQRELLILRRRALSAAANLGRDIEDATGASVWVQAVVVLWSEFPAGCLQDGRCVFVAGPRLIDWLRRRPGQLSPERAAAVHSSLERLAAASDQFTAPIAA